MCLENLWHCARAYNQLGIAVPLPPSARITLTSPELTQRIRTEEDITIRVTGRCVQALIVNELAGSFQPRISFRDGVHYDAELACMLSLLDTEPDEFLRWPRPSAVIKLQNFISLMSSEIGDLFTSWTAPADVMQIVQQTLHITCSDPVRGVFSGEDLPMDQALLLRNVCWKIANTRPANRFRDETVGLLERLQLISKQLPTVESKMRRCASLVFDRDVRGRCNLPTRPERRRRSKSM
jgi:hypothetical protein